MPAQTLSRNVISTGTAKLTACPVCGEEKRSYLFVVRGLPICQCPQCDLILLHPHPDHADFHSFYTEQPADNDPRILAGDTVTDRDASERYLELLNERGLNQGRLMLIASPAHPFAEIAKAKGYTIERQVTVSDLEREDDLNGSYDAIVIFHQLERAANPSRVMRLLRQALTPRGILLLTTPSVESWPCKLLGPQWTEWRPENRYYFSHLSIQSLLSKNGFGELWVEPDRRLYTLRHIFRRALKSPRSLLTRLAILLYYVAFPFRDARLRFSCSGIIAVATRTDERIRPLCSIIVPAYNERDTFNQLMDELLEKKIAGADKEIIIVESNSKDGTCEAAQKYQSHPDVVLILQDKPRGKGNAVRAGLERARGDIIMIQDADLEYDLNDYDTLLEPLLKYKALFVLGARHGGHWKMRKFKDNGALSTYMNFGHVFFTTLLNVLYRQQMKDPFTMFKVFRRDCLYGLEFHCNRFDFDFELVIKLVRKGYVPLEIPVNYKSRSFSEGKKVSMWRDPCSWIWILFKLRVTPLRRKKRT